MNDKVYQVWWEERHASFVKAKNEQEALDKANGIEIQEIRDKKFLETLK